MKPVIQLFNGGYYDLEDPWRGSLPSIQDVAHALAMNCRFTGHCAYFYSVAQHCVLVADYLRETGANVYTQYAGLMHDAHESVLGDIASPLKAMLPDYRNLEALHELFFRTWFDVDVLGLADVDWGAVKHADLVLLATERRAFLPDRPSDAWSVLDGIEPWDRVIVPAHPAMAAEMFKNAYDVLTIEIQSAEMRGAGA